MVIDVVAIGLVKNRPLLEAFVYSFVAAPDALLHVFILDRICKAGRAFHFSWCFAPVSIIRFDTLMFAKVVLQGIAKNTNIRPFFGGKLTMDPGYEVSQYVQANFVSKCRLHQILVG